MKLLNYTTSWFAAIILVIIPLWAGIFYYSILGEIYDSIDDGLDNRKGLIIRKAATDTAILYREHFDEADFVIRPIPAARATKFKDVYTDTLMFMQNEKDFEPVRLLRTVFLHNGKYYQMDVITSMVEEDDLISELLIALILLYVALVITAIIVNNFVLKRTWRPFYKLLEQLGKFRLERLSPISTSSTTVEEFQLLQDTLQKMLQSNIDSYTSQKQFIENAAHELQTPLAIAINKLEAVADSERLGEHDSEMLSSALDNLERLSRLNRSLLLLTRIENRQYDSEVEVDVTELTQQLLDDLSELIRFRDVSVRVDQQGVCKVRMNSDLAGMLLTNLIKNAIIHTNAGGEIVIDVRADCWSISNTSDGSPLDSTRVFNRFYKHDVSSPSTGLGLSIANAIAVLYGFRLEYAHRDSHHFIIYF